MIRLLLVAAILSFACRMILGRWPWYYLGEQPTRQQALFRARKLLGVSADAGHTQIIEAHRRLIAVVHPDRGGTSEQVHEANAARDLLLAELPDRAS
ncbi:molecular chaperone DnaJ [Tsuneonella mangrovi]|uniref:molecular chaperone DnaJ n=1 Tax=Tsuneonella mangrovi TaxID=1982042 RepID=UPI000BA21AD8|nr:molecular chaperone DnaJ [Tsuneonella mangrovi]